MSDVSPLSDLASFVGKSPIADEAPGRRRQVMSRYVQTFVPRHQKRRVGDLLSVVLALSARTRRMMAPRVDIDLDVFSPQGGRAVRMVFGDRD